MLNWGLLHNSFSLIKQLLIILRLRLIRNMNFSQVLQGTNLQKSCEIQVSNQVRS